MKKHTKLTLTLLAVLFIYGNVSSAGTTPERMGALLNVYRDFIVTFQESPDQAIPLGLLANCRGIIIMRQFRAGLGIGVRGGEGVVLLRDARTNTWSPPAFIRSGEGSFGLQIGGQSIDAIFLIMNQEGVDMLLRTRFRIGVDASAAAGPVGRNAAVQLGVGTAILAYSRARGLFAGVAFEGGVLISNDRNNRALYGRDVSLRGIVIDGRVPMPREAGPLVQTLTSFSAPQPRR